MKFRKLLSLALSLVMLLSMFVTIVSAEPDVTEITSIVFETAVSSPADGEALYYPVPYSVNGDTELLDLLGSKYSYWKWHETYETDSSDYYSMNDPVFTAGYAYMLVFDIYCDYDAAVFAEDCTFTLKTPDGDLTGEIYFVWSETNYGFYVLFDLTDETPELPDGISSLVFESERNIPVNGNDVYDLYLASVNGRELLANVIERCITEWGYSDTYSESMLDYDPYQETTFVAGYSYALGFMLVAADGFGFAEDCTLTIKRPTADDISADIFIEPAAVLDSELSSNIIFCTYFDVLPETLIIESITFEPESYAPFVDESIYGAYVTAVNGKEELVDYIASSDYKWFYSETYSTDGDAYDEYPDDYFVAGYAYDLCLNIMPNAAVFSDDCAYYLDYNGSVKEGYLYNKVDGEAYVDFFFEAANEPIFIESFEFKVEVVKPAAGKALYYAVPYSINGDTELAMHYGEIYQDWYYNVTNTENGYDYSLYHGDEFVAGYAYDLFFDIYVLGATISEDCTLSIITPKGTLNGKLYATWGDQNFGFDLFFDVVPENIGDVNGDESIDTRDYVLVARSYMGTYNLSDDQETRADVNADNAIDTRDYVLIARHYMGTYTIGG